MHAPYRIATPPEPVRTEEADSYEARLLAGRKRYWAQMGLLFASVFSVGWMFLKASHARPSGAEKARRQEAIRVQDARATVKEAHDQLDRAQASFDAAIHAAIEKKLGPATPLTACPVVLGDPERLVRGRASIPLLVIRKEDAHYYSPSLEHARHDVATAESLLDGVNPMSAVVYSDALEANPIESRLSRDVVIVASHWKSPSRFSETEFEPGAVDGMAYVFDFETRRITCAGEIHASNSKSLPYTYSDMDSSKRGLRLDETLADDLERQIAGTVAAPNALFSTH